MTNDIYLSILLTIDTFSAIIGGTLYEAGYIEFEVTREARLENRGITQ